MVLPPAIEVVPVSSPITAEVTIPGSKSITNRALVLAALSNGETRLAGALWSEDTQVMVSCLRQLGFKVDVLADPAESANRTITVQGGGGRISGDAELFVGNSGTTARFLAALVCLGTGTYRLVGAPRMHDRPQQALLAALRDLGYRVESENGRLPMTIYGGGPRPGAKCRVSIAESSQFASALLMVSGSGGWEVSIYGENAEESPYVRMTAALVQEFPRNGGVFQIEPDASSASYFWGAGWLLKGSDIRVAKWNSMAGSLQIDAQFPKYLNPFPSVMSRKTDLGDSIMTAIVLAPFTDSPKHFTDLGRLRVQECERVQALHTELKKCGARVIEDKDTLTIFPTVLEGAEIETYGDHRIAMCFAMIGLRVPRMRIKNPSVVEKTFPNFFEKIDGLRSDR